MWNWTPIVDDPSMVSWSVSRSVCRSIDRPFLTGIFLSKKSSANVLLRIQIGAIKGVEQGRHSIPTSPWTFSRQVHLSLESLQHWVAVVYAVMLQPLPLCFLRVIFVALILLKVEHQQGHKYLKNEEFLGLDVQLLRSAMSSKICHFAT